MPATLTLEGRVLTLTDEGQSSSVDLSGIKGDMGVRGEQGEPGKSAVDLDNYYTKAEVENLIETTDTHYVAFWDSYQQNGTRTDYNYAFYNVGWNPETYKPAYEVKPTTANYAYMYSTIEEIELLNLSECSGCTGTFSNAKQLQKIKRLVMGDKISNINNMFRACEELIEIGFEGTFKKSGLTLQYSAKLNRESILKLFEILADVSGTGTEYSLTLGEDLKAAAGITAADEQIATQKGWTIY